MFIVLEGIDGCGKSTQARNVAKWLLEEGLDVALTAEPTEGRIGSFIREILAGRETVEPETLALLFTADRIEHLKNEIEPALSAGTIVVCERYYHSTIAYQTAQGVGREWLAEINRPARSPDLTIHLDIAPEKAIERASGVEIFENLEFLKKVYSEYMKFDDMVKVDASGDVDSVYDEVKRVVSDCINKARQGVI